MRDLRFAWRLLLRNPLPSLVIVGSLALGIGGAASVFTVLNALVLRTLPVVRADQLRLAERHTPNGTSPRFSWPQVIDARSEISSRAEIAAMSDLAGMQVRMAGEPGGDRALVQLVSGEYFEVLGEQAQLGRVLTTADNRDAAPPVAVISDGYWQRRLGRARTAIGQTLVINGAPITIAGVAAPGFQGTSTGFRGTDLWIPLLLQSAVHYASNSSSYGSADTMKPWPPQREIEWLRLLVRVPDERERSAISSAIQLVLAREVRAARASEQRAVPSVILVSAARGVSNARNQLTAPGLAVLAAISLVAAYLPARRAAGIEPMAAVREA